MSTMVNSILIMETELEYCQLIRREVGMPSAPPTEVGESSLIASIMIESERVISVRNKLSSRVACERKMLQGL